MGRRRRPGSDWVDGVAVIRESDRGHDSSGADPSLLDDVLDLVGSTSYRFTLEVTVAGREPYPVAGRFKVPKRAESTGMLGRGGYLAVGLELPVRVDPADPGAVAIDWDRFLASPGRKEAVREAMDARRVGHMRADLERKPELAAQLRANNRAAATAWVEAVRAGNMSPEELERELTLEVETGRMDPADAEAARRSLAAEPPAGPADPRESQRIRKAGRKTVATVLERTDTGGAVHRLRLDVEGREIVHYETLNDRWAALLEPGMETAVFVDPSDPGRIALG